MSTSQSSSSSENAISNIIKQGTERGAMYVSAGLVIGGLASIVLARGGGGSRKAITAFGTGVGMGAAWTRCSIDIEEAVKGMK
mmetsp:Transcript_12383/g.21453  ORF Transcript_12383/g.21453 Transcript_12383/m.21453 type:complete len:83 (-) Transcript_12383:254-502(-)|eukprot:CAMPEP_0183764762 /NCGR_PEP_ID=MMETSP0739-20130205/10506_1 /TAXON_ID=385413 /ORGANISM="Thalassiosira miniscula, Strain CCMP1093" /LENGTH=82 /DNA_ID=CAMNT_0026003341 /DNA_START=234 /DNA_END=482 /DNA_ORIENTATION=+